MGKEHLDLLSEPHRDVVLFGFGNVAGNLTGVFVFFAGDLARIGIWAAFCFGWASLARQFQGAILGDAFAVWASVGIRIIAAELLERLAFWANVLVVLCVPFEVCAAPGAVRAARFINDRDVGCDLAVHQPTQHWARAVSSVCDDPFGVQIKSVFDPIQHRADGPYLGLSD